MDMPNLSGSPLMSSQAQAFLAATNHADPQRLQQEAMLAAKLGTLTNTGRPLSFADALAIKQVADQISKANQMKAPPQGNALQDYVQQKLAPPQPMPQQPPPQPPQMPPQMPPQDDPRVTQGIGAMPEHKLGMAEGGIVAFGDPARNPNENQVVRAKDLPDPRGDTSGYGAFIDTATGAPPHIPMREPEGSLWEDAFGVSDPNEQSQFGMDLRSFYGGYQNSIAAGNAAAEGRNQLEKQLADLKNKRMSTAGMFSGYFTSMTPEKRKERDTQLAALDSQIRATEGKLTALYHGTPATRAPVAAPSAPAVTGTPNPNINTSTTGATPPGTTAAPAGATGPAASTLDPNFLRQLAGPTSYAGGIGSISTSTRKGPWKLDPEELKLIEDMKSQLPSDVPVEELYKKYVEALGPNEGLEQFKKDMANYKTEGGKSLEKLNKNLKHQAFAAAGEEASKSGQAGSALNRGLASIIAGQKAYYGGMPELEKIKMQYNKDVMTMGYDAAKADRDERLGAMRDAIRESSQNSRERAAGLGAIARFTAQVHHDDRMQDRMDARAAAQQRWQMGTYALQNDIARLTEMANNLDPNDPQYTEKRDLIQKRLRNDEAGLTSIARGSPGYVTNESKKFSKYENEQLIRLNSAISAQQSILNDQSKSKADRDKAATLITGYQRQKNEILSSHSGEESGGEEVNVDSKGNRI
jgi:hypothetical protein